MKKKKKTRAHGSAPPPPAASEQRKSHLSLLAPRVVAGMPDPSGKLGIDVGRVLISPGDDSKPDTSFIGGSLEQALQTPPYEGMFDVVPLLVRKFESRVWIISKCGPRIQQRTLQWFRKHRFFERTGINPSHVRFCLKRPEKALHCAELGITHFIDDRTDVLSAMEWVVPNRYLFGPQRDEGVSSRFTTVLDWAEVARKVR